MIIWAGSFPRSGSTLWRIAWHTYTGLPTYSYANDPLLNGVLPVGQKKLPFPWAHMGRCEGEPTIYMIKTHQHPSVVDPYDKSRLLWIVRDVRDTVVSLAHYTSWRQKKDFAAELDRIVHNTQWLHFCNAWGPAAGATIRYEDLRADPRATVLRIVKELDIPVEVNSGQMPPFANLHKREPRFFRRGITGGWRGTLSEEQEAQLWESFGWKMKELGYKR